MNIGVIFTGLVFAYMVMICSFITELNSCDLQRLISSNMYVKHIVALTGFFFMIVLVDESISVMQAWGVTIIVYVLYYLSTRAKLFYNITIILLLVIHENLNISYKRTPEDEVHNRATLQHMMNIIRVLIIIFIVLGVSHYYIRQREIFGGKFSNLLFFLGTRTCEGS